MKKYIYLDWNVIQFIKKKTYIEEKSIDGERFGNLVEKLKKRYVFPFSEAHLRDLSISKEEYHDEDLDFLYKISDNNVLGFDDNENLMSQNHLNIKDVFSFILDKQKKEEQDLENVKINYFMPNSFEVDLNKVTEDNILKPFIEQNSGILDTKVFIAFLEYSKENMNDHKFYKQFRNNVASLKKMYQKNDTIINQESIYFKKLIPFLDFILMDNIELIKEKFSNIIKSFLKIDNRRELESLRIGAKIDLAYSLLDFNPNFRDKIDKKNRPNNMLRDIKHLHFASEAKYYITEDKMTYKKSKFVSEVLGFKVKVLTMDELLKRIEIV